MPLTRPKAAQINFDVTTISDPLLRFNSGQTGSNDKDAGFIIERGDDTNVGLVWDESADEFAVVSTTETGTTSGNITISAYSNIRANTYYGDGSNLTGISGAFTAESDGASLTETRNDSSAGPVITLIRDKSGTVYDADYLGQIKFKGDNDAGQSNVYAKMTAKVLDASDGSEDGLIEYAVKKNGSNTIVARLRGDSLQLLNGANLTVAGTVDATSYTGDGSGLSGIATNSISQGDSNLTISDTGTGTATVTLDNATHTTFNSTGIVLASGTFSGTATSAQYADLAEIYTSDKDYEPGTVLIFGGEKEVTTTNIMADHRVAGVVSTNPAHLMNSDCEGVAVALRGRVPCKVDGPVRKGDIIVSGPEHGIAVALAKESSMPNAVCVIGKAIEENLQTGIHIVEIVV